VAKKKAKRAPIAKHITEGGRALAEIMAEGLAVIANDMISQVMAKSRRAIPSQKLKAISGLAPRGTLAYKNAVLSAFAVIASDALKQVRKEIPAKKNVRLTDNEDTLTLSEFDRLPPKIQRKIKSQTDLLIGKQLGDLQKIIEFAYAQAEEETDSDDQIEQDMRDSAVGWLDGTAIESGAELNAATTVNFARNAFFFDDEVMEGIDAMEFMNEDPVTQICQDLTGTIFDPNDPIAQRFSPPLHWRCKSWWSPIPKGQLGDREIEKLKPSKKSLEDEVQFSEPSCSHCGKQALLG